MDEPWEAEKGVQFKYSSMQKGVEMARPELFLLFGFLPCGLLFCFSLVAVLLCSF